MPVILREGDYAGWLDASNEGQSLLVPFDDHGVRIAEA